MRLRFVVVLPLLLVGNGCAAAKTAWRSGPAGISAEWAIRDHLVYGRATQAWAAMGDKQLAPGDALLRHMYRGVIALHAGEFEAGSRSMDRAWEMVEDRFTKRVSVGAASLVTSDATLPYYPGPTEHLFIPYYGALNWLARNELDETAVEARRMSQLLASEEGPRPPSELLGVMRYVSGVLYEAAGERQDALVAYRNAAAILGELPGDTIAPGFDEGDVVVIIEDGFVGRPEPQTLGIYMSGDELVGLTTGNDASRVMVAQRVGNRRLDPSFERPGAAAIGWLTYEVNWATFGSPSRTVGALGVRAFGSEAPGTTLPTLATSPSEPTDDPRAVVATPELPTPELPTIGFRTVSTTVTRGVQADFERELPARLGRAITRTAVRFAAMQAAEKAFEKASDDRKKKKDAGEKGGGWGSILLGVGLAATSVTSAVIDQPDLRAWQLLPDRLTVARVRLPVGDHPIEIVRGDEVVSLGVVTVRPGRVAVLTHRWWPGPGPSAPRALPRVE